MRIFIKFLLIVFLTIIGIVNANAETSYIYYYGNGCPHCANVDEYMKGVDGYNKIDIEKREVYFDSENAKLMSEDAERLGLGNNVGVPFLIINDDGTETPLVGDTPIIEYFTPILGEPVPPSETKKIIAVIIFFLVGLSVAFMIIKGQK